MHFILCSVKGFENGNKKAPDFSTLLKQFFSGEYFVKTFWINFIKFIEFHPLIFKWWSTGLMARLKGVFSVDKVLTFFTGKYFTKA